MTLHTARLILRPWRAADLPAIAALNSDAAAMEFFPRRLDRAETEAWVARQQARQASDGFCLWAAEFAGACIGAIGLLSMDRRYPFGPAVEVGWRLDKKFWGLGLAPEGARACLDYAFRALHLAEVVAITVPANARSRRVMEKLGMIRDLHGDFDHPDLAPGEKLRQHVLYRIARP